jgi:hypothetical protein
MSARWPAEPGAHIVTTLSFVAPDTEAWMRKLPILAFFLVAACGQEGEEAGNGVAGGAATGAPGAPVQTATLTGLYETGGSPPSQLCITERGRAARFGLVIRRNGRAGCSGAGTAARTGAALRLTMNGDSPCVIEARLEGRRLTFPPSLPAGCSYYCAPGAAAGAGGMPFSKTGGTRADALRARDIVGDPLCA